MDHSEQTVQRVVALVEPSTFKCSAFTQDTVWRGIFLALYLFLLAPPHRPPQKNHQEAKHGILQLQLLG